MSRRTAAKKSRSISPRRSPNKAPTAPTAPEAPEPAKKRVFILRSNKVIAGEVIAVQQGGAGMVAILQRAIVLEEANELRDKQPCLVVRPRPIFPPNPYYVLHMQAVDIEVALTGLELDLYDRYWADLEAKRKESAAAEAAKATLTDLVEKTADASEVPQAAPATE